jgi:hypothetical protein
MVAYFRRTDFCGAADPLHLGALTAITSWAAPATPETSSKSSESSEPSTATQTNSKAPDSGKLLHFRYSSASIQG